MPATIITKERARTRIVGTVTPAHKKSDLSRDRGESATANVQAFVELLIQFLLLGIEP
jgi:hypothetical protein